MTLYIYIEQYALRRRREEKRIYRGKKYWISAILLPADLDQSIRELESLRYSAGRMVLSIVPDGSRDSRETIAKPEMARNAMELSWEAAAAVFLRQRRRIVCYTVAGYESPFRGRH